MGDAADDLEWKEEQEMLHEHNEKYESELSSVRSELAKAQATISSQSRQLAKCDLFIANTTLDRDQWRTRAEIVEKQLAEQAKELKDAEKKLAEPRRCYACAKNTVNERAQCFDCWTAIEANLLKLKAKLKSQEAVIEAAKKLINDIQSDADGCYDVGHLKSLTDALASLEGK